ncbi:hypothetical protein Z043_102170, partial [Scleropages formosus]
MYSWGNDNNVHVVAVKYDYPHHQDKIWHVHPPQQAPGHTMDPIKEVLQKFSDFSLEMGILPENIVIFPK